MLRDFQATDPVSADFRDAVNDELDDYLISQEPLITDVGITKLMAVARSYTLGGKRLRPAFCYWSYIAAGGETERDKVLRIAASLDLLHVSALVHDDFIDAADTRRGQPAAHRQYEEVHRDRTGRGDAAHFGASAAVILGDMLLMWSADMFDTSGAANLDAARRELSRMRMEVTAGQFLDISAAFDVADDDDALRVANTVLEYKSASYSIRRPAMIGARLAGADEDVVEGLGRFGSHIGHAFQLRDDVLGVFGDEQVTGKPTGGDLREGKATVLVLGALETSSGDDRAHLESVLASGASTDDDIARATAIIEASGARANVEAMIDEHLDAGLAALEHTPLTDDGRTALTRLAELSVRRTF